MGGGGLNAIVVCIWRIYPGDTASKEGVFPEAFTALGCGVEGRSGRRKHS